MSYPINSLADDVHNLETRLSLAMNSKLSLVARVSRESTLMWISMLSAAAAVLGRSAQCIEDAAQYEDAGKELACCDRLQLGAQCGDGT